MQTVKPLWAKTCEMALIEKNMKKKELAKELNENYTQVCGVLNGYVVCERIARKICDYLNVTR